MATCASESHRLGEAFCYTHIQSLFYLLPTFCSGVLYPSFPGSLMPQTKDPCQKAACAIQKCLQLNNYMENRCEQEIQAMRNCCSKLATQQSICCSGFQAQQETKGNLKGSPSMDGTRTAYINS